MRLVLFLSLMLSMLYSTGLDNQLNSTLTNAPYQLAQNPKEQNRIRSLYKMNKNQALWIGHARNLNALKEALQNPKFNYKYKDGIVKTADYKHVCDEIRVLFKELRDPHDGKQIIENVYQWDEIYGKDAKNPPDIVFDLKEGVTASEWIRFPDNIHSMLQSRKRHIPYIFNKDPSGRSGDHAQYGVFYAYGKGVKSNYEVGNISVEDVLPTIFAAMNIPIPNSVDGKVQGDIFMDKPVVKKVDWDSYSSDKQILAKSELEKIRELRKKF